MAILMTDPHIHCHSCHSTVFYEVPLSQWEEVSTKADGEVLRRTPVGFELRCSNCNKVIARYNNDKKII